MSSVRVPVQPEVLEWARTRAGIDGAAVRKAFRNYDAWLEGDASPTWNQLKQFAHRTHVPFGYLLLDEPVAEALPVPDLRTIGDAPVRQPSADLLEIVFQCQRRQDWYHDHVRAIGEDPLPMVGRAAVGDDVESVAADIAATLGWDAEARGQARTWTDALAELRRRAEDAGILVMISGQVGANTHRVLDPDEFRGLALADPYAAVVFVNGRDSKAAQVFTLVHELAHVWSAVDGVSDLDAEAVRTVPAERWCNAVAAEVLVPMTEFRASFDPAVDISAQLQPLAEQFRVSTQVILGRIREAGSIGWDEYLSLLAVERTRAAAALAERSTGGGGSFYNSKPVQVSRRFARAVIASTLEGRTAYSDAFRMLDVKKQATFDELGARIGIA